MPSRESLPCRANRPQGGIVGDRRLLYRQRKRKSNSPSHCPQAKPSAGPYSEKRGQSYTNFGVQIRCARPDQTTLTNVLHYLDNGNIILRFSWRKAEYLIPVMMILNALVNTNDKAIFDGIAAGRGEEAFIAERVEGLLRTYKTYQLYTQRDTLAYLGEKFRVVFDEAEDITDEHLGEIFLHRVILVHLTSNADKFRLLM
jgi:DNA-directed RNA polymerase I subunit RPA2